MLPNFQLDSAVYFNQLSRYSPRQKSTKIYYTLSSELWHLVYQNNRQDVVAAELLSPSSPVNVANFFPSHSKKY